MAVGYLEIGAVLTVVCFLTWIGLRRFTATRGQRLAWFALGIPSLVGVLWAVGDMPTVLTPVDPITGVLGHLSRVVLGGAYLVVFCGVAFWLCVLGALAYDGVLPMVQWIRQTKGTADDERSG